jgi:hypothetical protein
MKGWQLAICYVIVGVMFTRIFADNLHHRGYGQMSAIDAALITAVWPLAMFITPTVPPYQSCH